MTTRSLLNKTSQKKKDTMLSFTDVTAANPESGVFAQGSAVMDAATASFFTFAWLASGRPAENSSGVKGSKIDEGTRTSTTIFARGLKERITLRTNSPVAWLWRRICFQIKKADWQDSIDPNTSDFFRITSDGMVRLVTEIPNQDIFIDLFEGARNQDWIDPMNAKVNTRAITVKYDRRITIASGNSSGIIRHYNMWHPINKNITYDDEQDGDSMFTEGVSVGGKQGSGDFYVVDMFQSNGGVSGETLEFLPQATFYWHEK